MLRLQPVGLHGTQVWRIVSWQLWPWQRVLLLLLLLQQLTPPRMLLLLCNTATPAARHSCCDAAGLLLAPHRCWCLTPPPKQRAHNVL
jgi:hypothetical protein